MASYTQVSLQVITCILKDYTGDYECRLYKFDDNSYKFGLFCQPGTDTGHELITSRFKSCDSAIKALYRHCIAISVGDTVEINAFYRAERLKFDQENKG